jgi:AraC-like DNA-binding protein
MRKSRFIIILTVLVIVLLACTNHGQNQNQTALQTKRDTAAMADWERASKYDRIGQKRIAEMYFKKAYDALKDNPARDWKTYTETAYGLMALRYLRYDLEGSMEIAMEVMKVMETNKDFPPQKRSCVLLQIAQNQTALKQMAEAERSFLKAYDELLQSLGGLESGNINPVIYACNLMDFYQETGEYDKYAEWLERSKHEFKFFEEKSKTKSDSLLVEEYKVHLALCHAKLLQGTGHTREAIATYDAIPRSQVWNTFVINSAMDFLKEVGRYDEIVDLFEHYDSSELSRDGAQMNFENIRYRLTPRYLANMKAGHKDEALRIGATICEAIDSALVWQRKDDATELAVIYQTHEKELQVSNIRFKLQVHRIILASAVLICLLIVYLLWRSYQYNKVLLEKNRRLLSEIEQREREEQQAIVQLKAEPQENLTANQQLFCRICDLMETPDHIYTDTDMDRTRLAQLLGTNEHYVTDAISACTDGKSVNGFLNEYRLRYAAHLLATTTDAVVVIAELSGFSRSSFFRVFSDAYGMSPSDYRQAARK